ncbi:7742_t:CDS:2 [Racocetra fulgida]|uniref:7742_t:CDS:1 n=1 Tax=Racocetra fulgida TaxID=60492 RepID=A0A9N9AY98_9GLOM|nr:7742_t:CDS:2 [Racocetra fulgida]
MGLTNSKSNNNTYKKVSFDISTKKELFKYANGRRFHNDENSKYFLPNDDEEGNYSSPVSDLLDRGGAKVLDTDYPRVSFTGIDISPIYPSEIKPCNLTFRTANILEGLPFPDNYFDFVYMRFLLTAFTEDEWQNKVIQELCRVVKPGGYLEIMEGDMVLNPEERLCPVGTWAGRVGEGICQDFCSTLYTLRCVLSDVLESEGIIGEKGEKLVYDDLVKGFVDEV